MLYWPPTIEIGTATLIPAIITVFDVRTVLTGTAFCAVKANASGERSSAWGGSGAGVGGGRGLGGGGGEGAGRRPAARPRRGRGVEGGGGGPAPRHGVARMAAPRERRPAARVGGVSPQGDRDRARTHVPAD